MKTYRTDVLVIGAGGAGLRAAVEAKANGADVLVVNKGVSGRTGCTKSAASDWMAFGAAFGHADPDDSPKEHWIDIMVKGGLICEPPLCKNIAFNAPDRLMDLENWGADFDKTDDGGFVQIMSDGARYPRACGRGADTGPVIIRVLIDRARQLNVEFANNISAVDLILNGSGEVVGCCSVNMGTGELVVFEAGAVVLAAGGAGGSYALNVFPEGMSGDGYAMAYRAGAEMVNMEFVQIGPSIVHPIHFALSGVFWRLNPRITNKHDEEFVPKYIPEGVDIGKAIYIKGVSYPFTIRNESKWVDVAAYTEIAEGRGTEHNGVYMDISHNDPKVIETEASVPFNHLMKYGIDLREDKVEFAPAIQHFNGGVHINVKAEATIPGLYAAGENAGGQHGADRPGGNALADCQAHGKIAGENAARFSRSRARTVLDSERIKRIEKAYYDLVAERKGSVSAEQALADLKWMMWKNASVVRTEDGLKSAISYISSAPMPAVTPDDVQKFLDYRNMLVVGRMVAESALMRCESRGTHYRADCAAINDPAWLKQILITQKADGMHLDTRPIELPPELEYLKKSLEGIS
jgi:succinate dehydrogenase/fumarate reductase flavoprotein subunit